MSASDTDTLLRNDNKSLSSGAQSADLSRSGGTPAGQQTASDPSAPAREQAGPGEATPARAPSPSSDPAPSRDHHGAPYDEAGPSTAASPRPTDQAQGPATDAAMGDGQEAELRLGASAEWVDGEGGRSERSMEISVDGAHQTNLDLASASSLTENQALSSRPAADAVAPAREAVADAAGTVEGALARAVDEVGDLPQAELSDALQSLDQAAVGDAVEALTQDVADLDPVFDIAAASLGDPGAGGFLSSLFNPGQSLADVGVGGLAATPEDSLALLAGHGGDLPSDDLDLIL